MTNLNSLQKCSIFEPTSHNDVKCFQSTLEEHRGTVNEFWFSVKLLCEIFDESKQTIGNNIKALIDDGELDESKIFDTTIKYKDSQNREHSLKIYNLEVLNKLGMCCFRGNKKAKEIRDKFNDVIVRYETNNNNNITLSKEDELLLNIIRTEDKSSTALALNEYKKFRDEKEHKLSLERDEAIRTKAYISTKREATLMGKVGGTTKALNLEKEKNNKLLKENIDLLKEKDELKIRLSESEKYKTVKQMTGKLSLYLDTKNNKNLQKIGKIVKQISLSLEKEVKKVDDLNFEKVNSYHVSAWKELFIRLNSDPYYLIEMRK